MDKYWVLVINAKLELMRMWVDNDAVIALIDNDDNTKVYRSSSNQEALIIYADPKNELVWQDVSEKKVG